MDHALALEHVTKRFGDTVAVDDLTFEVAPGDFLGLLGRNGAGKTTTIGMCTGLLRPSRGTVRVLGLDVQQYPLEAKKRLGVMSQEEGFFDCLTGPQYLYFVARIHGLPERDIASRSAELFETLDLSPQPGALVREYSGGMKKKLALCAALIHGPRILFLDEPFEGIDPVTGRTIRDILLGLHRKGTTILMSSHALDLVERLCPKVAIIDRGCLQWLGTVDGLREARGRTGSLEELFIELAGGVRKSELSWL